MVSVGRPINGISINGLEWLLNDEGTDMLFKTEEEAKVFLKLHGYTDDCMEGLVFEDSEQTD